ncbi:hypothetical protein SDC9_87261 [bioreactor metagenome]|uniref:Uncharacterized protein n=1 Tax=bioreactor metagenome TaxID=1076179 RepID=A0A644ZIR3_9ZZZZ
MGVKPPGLPEIRQDLLQRADRKALFLVHAAKGAGVVAAPVSHLNDEAPCLGRGAVYASVVVHFKIFSNAASFSEVHSTSMAASSSESGGRDGAMRMLLSSGSFP